MSRHNNNDHYDARHHRDSQQYDEEDLIQLQHHQDNNIDDDHNRFENYHEDFSAAEVLVDGLVEEEDDDVDVEDDIPEELVEGFFEEMDNIPLESKLEYRDALLHAPELLQSESNPIVFLRFAEYDPAKAAKALCDYWKKRIEIFGSDNAFKPMTLHGACKGLEHAIMKMPTYFRILPKDDSGRKVLCTDRTDVDVSEFDDQYDFVKYLWYIYHNHLNSVCDQKTGIVFLWIKSRVGAGLGQLQTSVVRDLCVHYLPIKVHRFHLCISSLALTRMATPAVKHFLHIGGSTTKAGAKVNSNDFAAVAQIHSSIKASTTLGELKEFGLHAKNLPTTIGGTYNNKAIWINECDQMVSSSRQSSSSNIMNNVSDNDYSRRRRFR